MKFSSIVFAVLIAVAGVASADRGPGNSRGVVQDNHGGGVAHRGGGVQQRQAYSGVQAPQARGNHNNRNGGQVHQGRDVTHNDYRANRDVRDYRRENTRIGQSHNNHVRPAHVAPFVIHSGVSYPVVYRDDWGWGYWHAGVWMLTAAAVIGTVAILTRPACYYEDREVIDRYGRLVIRTVEICPTRW
ncbi:MAG: hypothetical protein Q8Q10_04650 [bacterium]|nr:hypothetical protein [bacterium]